MLAHAVSLKKVPCPKCGIRLHEVPEQWRAWILPLPSREAATGLGSVKLCYGKRCKDQYLEIHEGPTVTLRMTRGWVLVT